MKRRSPLVTVFAALVTLLGVALAPPALAAVPPASVQLEGPGTVGRFDTAIVPVQVRCRSGLQPQTLLVTVRQDGVSGRRTTSAPACDGAWHALRVEVGSSTGAPFNPGMVYVTARLTVHNPVTGRTRSATDTRFVKLLAAAEVGLGTVPVRRSSTGVIRVPVRYRCQTPWVPVQLSVEVTQNDGFLGGQTILTEGDPRLVCDAMWHRLMIRVSASNGSFFVGPAQVYLLFDIQDPVDFDPVDQASFIGTTQIVNG
jgi:hypothetical protein